MRSAIARWRGYIIWGGLLGLFLWVAPPLHRYRPACGDWLDKPIDAPLRPVAVEMVHKAFSEVDLPHFIIGGQIYVTWFDAFDYLNWEWGYAFRIASGQAGSIPPAVQRLVARWEAEHGEKVARYPEGDIDWKSLDRMDQCAIKRAALTFADGD